jgi:membrane protein YdbS with pleckstrin-like domain
MLCPTCHADIPADAAFCPKCGQRLAVAQANPSAAPVATAAAAAPTATEKFRAALPTGQPHPEPENDLWNGTYSAKAMYGKFAAGVLITLAGIVLAVLVPFGWVAAVIVIPLLWAALLLTLLFRRLGIEYRLTTQRFLHKRGLLRRVSDQILLVDVDDVTFEQGPLERLLNVGTITIHSNDASDPKLRLAPVDDVQRIADLIDNARREERRKRAIYMASA